MSEENVDIRIAMALITPCIIVSVQSRKTKTTAACRYKCN